MRFFKRSFLNPADTEVEICMDVDNKCFVRHHMYWSLVHGNKNPDPTYNCIIDNLKILTNHRLPTIKWAGHEFRFERIIFDDGMEVEAVLLPLAMFEDFIRFHMRRHQGEPLDKPYIQLGRWLENSSLETCLDLQKDGVPDQFSDSVKP